MASSRPSGLTQNVQDDRAAVEAGVAEIGDTQDHRYKRRLGWPSLTALMFSGMVGSGWLFASYYSAKAAGPMALGSWVIAFAATALIGVTFIELAVTRPIAGGNARWPSILSGSFVGAMVGWVLFLQAALPTEATGLLQYASFYWHGLVDEKAGNLSTVGLLIAAAVLVIFAAVNYLGVQLIARINNLVTVFKVVVPGLTVVMLIASGFDPRNIATGGGWSPMGNGAVLTALTAGGLMYAFGGIQAPAIMAGETRRPRRDVPIATFVGLGAAFALYILLQIAFIGGVPNDMLAKVGWHGINFSSPFADIAVLMNLGWLSVLLLVDSVVSPAGSAFVGTTQTARNTYGLGQNHTFPSWVARVSPRFGTPGPALLVNTVASLILLVVFQSWQGMAAALGMFFAVSYAVIAVAAGVNHLDPRLTREPWLKRGMPWVAPATFVFSGLIMYWAGWSEVVMAVLLFLISLPLYAYQMTRNRRLMPPPSVRYGIWFLAFMLVILGFSWIGSFGGRGWLAAPYDSIIVGAVSLGFYLWGYRSSKAWLLSAAAAETAGEY